MRAMLIASSFEMFYLVLSSAQSGYLWFSPIKWDSDRPPALPRKFGDVGTLLVPIVVCLHTVSRHITWYIE